MCKLKKVETSSIQSISFSPTSPPRWLTTKIGALSNISVLFVVMCIKVSCGVLFVFILELLNLILEILLTTTKNTFSTKMKNKMLIKSFEIEKIY